MDAAERSLAYVILMTQSQDELESNTFLENSLTWYISGNEAIIKGLSWHNDLTSTALNIYLFKLIVYLFFYIIACASTMKIEKVNNNPYYQANYI